MARSSRVKKGIAAGFLFALLVGPFLYVAIAFGVGAALAVAGTSGGVIALLGMTAWSVKILGE